MTKIVHNWRAVKAKIVVRFGTCAAAAAKIGCSTYSLHLAVQGRAPKVFAKLKSEGLV